ncbi:MAG: RNA-binding protein [Cyanobacteria bacterium P01_A01_bin.105]
MSMRLYVGNLSKDVQHEEFEAVFSEDKENIISIKLIADRKTGKCRGFGFVTVKSEDIADALVEKYNGLSLQDAELKVEKALPRSKEGNEADSSESAGRRNGNKKGRKAAGGTVVASTDNGPVQPDPRWAQDLEKLKELLAAQTTAS